MSFRILSIFLTAIGYLGGDYSWYEKPFNQLYSIYLENAELSSDKKSVEILDKTKAAIVSYRMSWDDYRDYFESIHYSDDWNDADWNYYRELRQSSWGDEDYINLATIKLNYRGEDIAETSSNPTQQVQNPGTSDFYPVAGVTRAVAIIAMFNLLYVHRRRNA